MIDARVEAVAAGLRVSYRVTNAGPTPMWIVDEMIDFAPRRGIQRAPDQWIVVDDSAIGLARLRRGFQVPAAEVASVLVPGARRVEGGASLEGAGTIALPLRSGGPQDLHRDLRWPVKRAVVEIAILEQELPFHSEALVGGGAISVAPTGLLLDRQRWVTSEALWL